jgi:hypothetical protein
MTMTTTTTTIIIIIIIIIIITISYTTEPHKLFLTFTVHISRHLRQECHNSKFGIFELLV